MCDGSVCVVALCVWWLCVCGGSVCVVASVCGGFCVGV